MDRKELEQIFKDETAAFPGRAAYLYMDMEGMEEIFSDRASAGIISASTIKVPVMMAVLQRLLEEGASLTETILIDKNSICEDSEMLEYGTLEKSFYELIVWMIIKSDNTATNVLIHYLGMDKLHAYFQSIGLKQAKIERIMLDFDAVAAGRNNYLSLYDFYLCMKLLDQGEVLTPEYCSLALDIMKQNRDDDCLNRYLYECPAIAHKTGGLDTIVHDAGMVYGPAGKYFLGIFISEFEPGKETEKEAHKLIGRLSRYVFDCEKSRAEIIKSLQ